MADEKPLNLVYWIRGGPNHPRPVKLRCTTPDGPKVVAIKAKSPRPWAEAARAVEALHASRVECLDDKGEVMRVVELEVPADAPTEEPLPEAKTERQTDLVLMSRLLAQAYERGAQQHREFADNAYARLVDLCSTAFARLEGFEKAWTRMLNAQVRSFAQGDAEPAPGNLVEQILGEVMKGMAARQMGAPPPSPASNGAGTKEGGEHD